MRYVRLVLPAFVLLLVRCGGDDGPTESSGDGIQTGDLLTVEVPGGESMEFVWIGPGSFTMGSPPEEPMRSRHEGPQQEVTITEGFWLARHELTQGQWQSAMGTTPWVGHEYSQHVPSNPNHPAVYISWDDVQSLIQELNAAAGGQPFRMPTEAEWEYACRAGTTTRWSFGDDWSQLANHAWIMENTLYAGEVDGVTVGEPEWYAHTVGTKLPNPWGLHDMHGNVEEWVQDGYRRDYASAALVDTLTGAPLSRVLRGGRFHSFRAVNEDQRSAVRDHAPPDSRFYSTGARLLRTE